MSDETVCISCNGKCCRDSYHYRVTHMGDDFYEHVCESCFDGTKPQPLGKTTLDLAALKASLAELDPERALCGANIEEVAYNGNASYTYYQCKRPRGHLGQCSARVPHLLAWPGFVTLRELVRLAEIATETTK